MPLHPQHHVSSIARARCDRMVQVQVRHVLQILYAFLKVLIRKPSPLSVYSCRVVLSAIEEQEETARGLGK